MSSWGLQVQAFRPQTPYLAFPAVVAHLLSPTFLPPSFLLPFLQRMDSSSSASILNSFFPPLPHEDWPQDCGF